MSEQMHPGFLELAKGIKDQVFPLLLDPKRKLNLFLIGAQATQIPQPGKLRPKLRMVLRADPKIRILYPEGLFDDLIYGEQMDLLALENVLARSVHAVVICPESPGSFAELGAFTNHPELCKRLIVIGDSQYEKQRSFIRLGPLRYLSQNKYGRVMWHDYDKGDVIQLAHTVVTAARKIGKDYPPDRNLLSLIHLERYLLAAIYVLQPISADELSSLVAALVEADTNNPNEGRLARATTIAVIGYLFRNKWIRLESNRYVISDTGKVELFQSLSVNTRFTAGRVMDRLRVEAINLYRRRKYSLEERRRTLRLTQLSKPLF